jgi:hypothetical protein
MPRSTATVIVWPRFWRGALRLLSMDSGAILLIFRIASINSRQLQSVWSIQAETFQSIIVETSLWRVMLLLRAEYINR